MKCKQCGKQTKKSYYCNDICKSKWSLNKKKSDRRRKQNKFEYEGIKPSDDQIVYPDYKEPLRKVKKGYGYMGTVAYTKDMNLIQCHICGKMYKSLSSHIYNTHGLNIDKYKDQFGLARSNSLVGNYTKELMIKTYERHKRKFLEYNKNNKKKTAKKLIESNKKRKGEKIRLEIRNKRGTCPDQLIDKIRKLYEKNGEVPTVKEFKREYNEKFTGQLYYYFGSWVKAVQMAGLKSVKEMNQEKYSRDALLQNLINLYEKLGRTPRTSDLKSPSPRIYQKMFGSLNHARREAGIPIIIETSPMRWTQTMDYNLLK